MHVRTLIRNAVSTALSGLATPATVLTEPHRRIAPDDLPAVLMSVTDDEPQPDRMTMGSPQYEMERTQAVSIELHAGGSDGQTIAETIDQMDLEVEQAIAASSVSPSPALGGFAEIVSMTESTIEWNSDQDYILAARTVVYSVAWRHVFGAPDAPEV